MALTYWSRHVPHDRRYCRSLSVRGTNTTLIRDRCLILPSRVLSICTKVWSEFSGPIGTIKRPPGANWSINYKKKTIVMFVPTYLTIIRKIPFFTDCGISLAAAPTWIASYGPRFGYPNLPSPTKQVQSWRINRIITFITWSTVCDMSNSIRYILFKSRFLLTN